MIHPFSGNCTWRSRIGEVWTRESVFRGPGELSLQTLSLPHTWRCLRTSPKTAQSPHNSLPLFAAGGHTYVYFHHYKRGELLGRRTRGPSTPPPPPLMHHFSHWSLATLSLEMSNSPSSGIVATLQCMAAHHFCFDNTSFLLVPSCYRVVVGTQKPLVASGWVYFSLARSFKGSQALAVPWEDVLFDKR